MYLDEQEQAFSHFRLANQDCFSGLIIRDRRSGLLRVETPAGVHSEMISVNAFLSYNAKDRRVAGRVFRELISLGVGVAIDTGLASPDDAATALSGAKCFIALLGRHGLAQEQQLEIKRALDVHGHRELGIVLVTLPGFDEAGAEPYVAYLLSLFNPLDLRAGVTAGSIRALASIVRREVAPDQRNSLREENSVAPATVCASHRRSCHVEGGVPHFSSL
jgi:TIR domain